MSISTSRLSFYILLLFYLITTPFTQTHLTGQHVAKNAEDSLFRISHWTAVGGSGPVDNVSYVHRVSKLAYIANTSSKSVKSTAVHILPIARVSSHVSSTRVGVPVFVSTSIGIVESVSQQQSTSLLMVMSDMLSAFKYCVKPYIALLPPHSYGCFRLFGFFCDAIKNMHHIFLFSWPPYMLQLQSYMIFICFVKPLTPEKICRYIGLYFLRTLMRSHDYLILITIFNQNLFKRCSVISLIFACLFLHISKNTGGHNIKYHDSLSVHVSQLNLGGGRIPTFSWDELQAHVGESELNKNFPNKSVFKFVAHNHNKVVETLYNKDHSHVCTKIPLEKLTAKCTMNTLKIIAKKHNIHIPSKVRIADAPLFMKGHHCQSCETHMTAFVLHNQKSGIAKSKVWYDKLDKDVKKERAQKNWNNDKKKKETATETIQHPFPPPAPSMELKETIVRNWTKDGTPSNFTESGCAVCGQLTPVKQLKPLSGIEGGYLEILNREGMGITRQERTSSNDPIIEIKGPVLDSRCTNICKYCDDSLATGLTPKYALAQGLWLGTIPSQLQDLSFTEQLLISRVRHNKCIMRASSGMHKMKCNAIMFENPMPKIYQRLPLPIEDLDEVLAFIFTGPCRPTSEDLNRTPLLVRRRKVAEALGWLKLNHTDYLDLEIDYDNLKAYPEKGPPVVVTYRNAISNKEPEATSSFDNDDEDGVEDGPCPFVVNGVTGEQLETMSLQAMIAKAAKHLREDNAGVLAISHDAKPQSIYHNPQLYPMMFPYLFPYGLGGIGNVNSEAVHMSDMTHKRKLLMYHDKRFQMDAYFPLVAFNHEQIKSSTTGGYLLTERKNFDEIANRLLSIDTTVLEDLSRRLTKGDRIRPETPEEKACYALISDLDHVGGHVQGSITSKKYMRNEIWSLISYLGAPSWFITFAPADNRHPIALYFADTKETFSPEILTDKQCYLLNSKNAVAGARFFHFMVQMFIKHVLGVDQDHPGIYGNTSAYYGTVEQQGRLTLHLHLLLWISGCFTPQKITDKIMDPSSDFQQKMVEYLEALCVGEFLTGLKNEVSEKIKMASEIPGYQDPVRTLPEPPPPPCVNPDISCANCDNKISWWHKFKNTVDDLLLRSNMHTHNVDKNGKDKSYCLDTKGRCKRRFPRDTFEQTMVEPKTGALNLKKGEPWMNTITPVLTYLLRSNSDVTSLLSGTAIKAVVAYVTDYITKQSLKTYSIFDVVKSIFDNNSEMIGGDLKRKEKVRKIFTQVVNSLTAKMEIGSPMASLYVLGNPDHYTGHDFIPFYWKSYVREVLNAWPEERSSDGLADIHQISDKVVINKNEGKIVGLSKVNDYVYRPKIYENVTLYDWIRLYEKTTKKSKINIKKVGDPVDDPEFDVSDDDLNIGPTKKYSDPVHSAKLLDNKSTLAADVDITPKMPSLKDFIEDDVGYLENELDGSDDELDIMDEPSESKTKEDQSFCPGHPQYRTHKAYLKRENSFIVPNFLPNTLPRADRGDREYYCCTMLTFFKPWR